MDSYIGAQAGLTLVTFTILNGLYKREIERLFLRNAPEGFTPS